MTSTRNPLQEFILTPQQQNLLFAALNSQSANGQSNPTPSLTPSSMNGSPNQGVDGLSAYQESPYLDYDYDFGGADSSFDFSYDDGLNAKMIGDLPGAPNAPTSESADNDTSDKRSHPDDEDDEDENGGAKRRESEDKVAKKPGRKPLTTEPSSKRKAQNRAAQRAFRERKEKHLKDLENKVQELEKLSESANNENKLLRAKVDKMTVELSEYKKRVSLMATNRSSLGPPRPFGQSFLNNINDVNFQFEFPKFGALPGPPVGKDSSSSPANAKMPSTRSNSNQLSPAETPKGTVSPSNSSSYSQIGMDSQSRDDLAKMSANLFNPITNGNLANASRISIDSHYSASGPTTTSSPSASSNSNGGGPSSSCGTSPEPFTQSPMGFKPVDTLTTIGEEHPGIHSSSQDLRHFGSAEMANFNWLPQHDFQFDPHLFGDYREPQENVLSTGVDESFFNDAFDMDFPTPYNLPVTGSVKKTNLIDQIDAAKEADDVTNNGHLLTCNKIWEKLQNCPKVQNGDFDLDGLCSDLQKKAKCSGSGAVVDEKDFKNVMEKYLGKCDKDLAAEVTADANA